MIGCGGLRSRLVDVIVQDAANTAHFCANMRGGRTEIYFWANGTALRGGGTFRLSACCEVKSKNRGQGDSTKSTTNDNTQQV